MHYLLFFGIITIGDNMDKLNNKGFAVSTILYGILTLTILILMLIFGIMKSSKDMNQELVESVEEKMNTCVLTEVELELCYFNGEDCDIMEYFNCLGKKLDSTLAELILEDNIEYPDNSGSPYVSSNAGINFTKASSSTNGRGLYYTSNNTEDDKTTYYFRGAVENNYVSFAGFTWRIVRINEDGSVRLILQNPIGISKYNNNNSNNKYVGYMYDGNTVDSDIKKSVDLWYEENLKTKYSKYLADAGFCNDRNGSSAYYVASLATGRLNTGTPQFVCFDKVNDLFTLKGGNKGNKDLKYPIGLITADEVMYAGASVTGGTSDFYLNNGSSSAWTMTPQYYSDSKAYIFEFSSNMATTGYVGGEENKILPVINLKSTTQVVSGNGTKSRPYKILTDN